LELYVAPTTFAATLLGEDGETSRRAEQSRAGSGGTQGMVEVTCGSWSQSEGAGSPGPQCQLSAMRPPVAFIGNGSRPVEPKLPVKPGQPTTDLVPRQIGPGRTARTAPLLFRAWIKLRPSCCSSLWFSLPIFKLQNGTLNLPHH